LNNFPEEPLFTLFVNDVLCLNFTEWPKNWIKIGS
jgi:hypothetical protein